MQGRSALQLRATGKRRQPRRLGVVEMLEGADLAFDMLRLPSLKAASSISRYSPLAADEQHHLAGHGPVVEVAAPAAFRS